VLAKIASKRRLDLRRWTLARAEPLAVRKIAAVLGVRYRELANGEFNHSSQLILLDPEGRILARTEKMTTIPDAEFLATLKQALRSPAYRREP
jgi:protein SCO1